MGRLCAFFVLFSLVLSLVTPVAFAADEVFAKVTPISQHFSTPDPNGDLGTKDCAAAALFMVLQKLKHDKKATGKFDYQTIRQTLRIYEPNIAKGIPLEVIAGSTDMFTEGAVSASFLRIETEWEAYVKQKLQEGLPIIVYVHDWNMLTPRSTYRTSHVVVIVGIDNASVVYVDPWDGAEYTMDKASFATAWGNPPGFFAVVFNHAPKEILPTTYDFGYLLSRPLKKRGSV